MTFLCLAAVAIDGDTLRCANIEAANGRVRLARIDAPELRRAGGPEAKAALAALITGPVHCTLVDADPRITGDQTQDRYGRIVARCAIKGRDLGRAMVVAANAKKWPS